MKNKNIKFSKKNWVLSVPIYNLVLDREINGEIVIGDVHFVSTKKIRWIRKKLGIPSTISEINNYRKKHGQEPIFDKSSTYAFLMCGNVS